MKLVDVIRDVLHLDNSVEVPDSSGPGRLPGWDSLGHINLMARLEAEYKVKIGMEEIILIENVGHIRELLNKRGIAEF